MWLQATGMRPNDLAGIRQIPGGGSHNYAALHCSVDSSNNLYCSHNKLYYVDEDREMASFRRTGHEAARVTMGG